MAARLRTRARRRARAAGVDRDRAPDATAKTMRAVVDKVRAVSSLDYALACYKVGRLAPAWCSAPRAPRALFAPPLWRRGPRAPRPAQARRRRPAPSTCRAGARELDGWQRPVERRQRLKVFFVVGFSPRRSRPRPTAVRARRGGGRLPRPRLRRCDEASAPRSAGGGGGWTMRGGGVKRRVAAAAAAAESSPEGAPAPVAVAGEALRVQSAERVRDQGRRRGGRRLGTPPPTSCVTGSTGRARRGGGARVPAVNAALPLESAAAAAARGIDRRARRGRARALAHAQLPLGALLARRAGARSRRRRRVPSRAAPAPSASFLLWRRRLVPASSA